MHMFVLGWDVVCLYMTVGASLYIVCVGISRGCVSMCNVLLSLESRYIPYFLLFSFILETVGPILSFSPFILQSTVYSRDLVL